MVNSVASPTLYRLRVLVAAYVGIVLATVVVLAVLSTVAPAQASSEAWGHAIIVAVFGVLLPLRLRAAARGSRGALRAVGVIAAVLAVVNVVEAVIPGLYPGWMRAEMVLIAVLMVGVVLAMVRERR